MIKCDKDGLIKHLIKRNHDNCISYVENLQEIILKADYIGHKSSHGENSFEIIKVLDNNVLVAIKFHEKNGYLYVASVYDINKTKLEKRIESGKLHKL